MSKLLIVDDEPHIRMLLEQTLEELEDEGVELLFAPNGKVAWEIIAQEEPELVFLDVMMPFMSGYEVCQKVREESSYQPSIILLTAKGQEFDKKRGEDCGANEYMTKPFNPDEILKLAKQLLNI